MNLRNLFGTDGVRGLANQSPMTGEVAMAIGRAVAYVLRKLPDQIPSSRSVIPVGLKALESNKPVRRARIVVGKDTRLSGYMIEQALASGICSMGADCILIGPLPTPGVAFVTQSMRADAGIMISASHNPYHDNGIKIFSADGFKLPDRVELEIERLVTGGPATQGGQSDELILDRPTHDLIGKASRIDDVHARYLVFLKSLFPKELDLIGTRLVLDCANGAAYKVAPLVFEELGAEVIRRGVSPNGVNINENCGALHPEGLSSATLEYRADLGIALDGDGDRCILTDECGEIVDGDQIIGLCAIQMKQDGLLKGDTVVTTPMSNLGLEVALKSQGIRLERAQVGDRYVVEMMRQGGYLLGGEQSGHIVFLQHSTTGDGILAALKILELMKRSGKKLSELKRMITLFPQVRQDVQVTSKPPLASLPEVHSSILAAEKTLAGRGRVFVRYSGTESLARVMLEGPDRAEISQLCESIASKIRAELGSIKKDG
jgi:phosphoglucosamine mutase